MRKPAETAKAKGEGAKGLLAAFMRGLAALAAAAFLALPAAADSFPGNDSDSIVIHITPGVDLGVEIDTANVTLDFTMAMGATSYTLTPATVTVLGNITPQELDVQGGNGASSWSLAANETPAIDVVRLYTLFSVARDSHPAEGDFSGAKNLVTTGVKRAGKASGSAASQNFENNSMSGGADMDNLPLGAQRQMWLRVDAPPETSVTTQQQFTVTLTATRSSM